MIGKHFWNGFWSDLGGIPKTANSERNLPRRQQQTIQKIAEETKEVATVCIIKDGKMLMGKRRDNNRFTNPGGHLEAGETPLEGAIREVKEEAGIDLNPKSITHLQSKTVTKGSGVKLKIHAFKANVTGEVPTSMQKDPDLEVYRWRWIPMDAVPKDIMDNLHVPFKDNILLKELDIKAAGQDKAADVRKSGPSRLFTFADLGFPEKMKGYKPKKAMIEKIAEGAKKKGFKLRDDLEDGPVAAEKTAEGKSWIQSQNAKRNRHLLGQPAEPADTRSSYKSFAERMGL